MESFAQRQSHLMNQIKIGTLINNHTQYIDIQSNNKTYEDITFCNLSNHQGESNFIKAVRAVLNKEVSVAMMPLVDVPLDVKAHGVIIGAVTQRQQPGYSLLLKNKAVDVTADLKAAVNSKIIVQSMLEKMQLESLNPSVQVTIVDKDTVDTSNFLNQNQYDGVVLPTRIIDACDTDIVKVDLHPREFIPKPGSGVIAFLVHPESIEFREFLKSIHHKETAELTNIERKSWQLAVKNDIQVFGAYCYKDGRNFFHISVCKADTALQMRNISLSTSAGLDDLAISSLIN